jgi:hypothetical protein
MCEETGSLHLASLAIMHSSEPPPTPAVLRQPCHARWAARLNYRIADLKVMPQLRATLVSPHALAQAHQPLTAIITKCMPHHEPSCPANLGKLQMHYGAVAAQDFSSIMNHRSSAYKIKFDALTMKPHTCLRHHYIHHSLLPSKTRASLALLSKPESKTSSARAVTTNMSYRWARPRSPISSHSFEVVLKL